MTAPGMNGQDPTMVPVSHEELTRAFMQAMHQMALKAATDPSAAEAKDFAAAIKDIADAQVVLDPAMDGTGVPIEHQLSLEREKAKSAQARADAPAQKRRRLRRTNDGFELEG